MNYDDFEKRIIALLTAGKYDEAENEKITSIPWLKTALVDDPETAKKILVLFSQLAGEAESFNNFNNLLEDLQSNKLISLEQANELIEASPANRWL